MPIYRDKNAKVLITDVYVNNYKSLVNFSMNFTAGSGSVKPVNVLIGTNGCGKSSVFEIITALRGFVTGGSHSSCSELFPSNTLTRWQDDTVQTFEIGLLISGNIYRYHLEVQHNENELCRVRNEYLTFNDKYLFESTLGKAALYNDRLEKGAEVLVDWQYSGVAAIYPRRDNTKLSSFKEAVRKMVICSPLPEMHPSVSTGETALPQRDLSDITSYYRYLVQSYPEMIHQLWEDLRECNPSFVRTYLDGGQENKTLYFEFDQKEHLSYKYSELSSGEQILFDLYLLLNGVVAKGYPLLIDEPDNYLSLREIQPWCSALEEAAETSGGQCIMISHHPEIIDYFGGTSGIWIKRSRGMVSTIMEVPTSNHALRYSEAIARGDFDEQAE